ncbi:MAG: PIN domain-containing protein [Cyanobacteria bacterium P01_A01_bin.17]
MTLCDTSPLIALLNKRDRNHRRCIEAIAMLKKPLLTTLPCFTEAMYLLGDRDGWHGQESLWMLRQKGVLLLCPLNDEQLNRANVLMVQYRDVPMDFGDASLVVAAETLNQTKIFTLDKDFYIYRLPGNQSFDVVPGRN